MCSLSLAPDCINQPLGNVSDTDVFGGTCGKREKGSFCFVCSSFWALLLALKKKRVKTFLSVFHSLIMSTEVCYLALSPPQLKHPSPVLHRERTPQLQKKSAAFTSPPSGSWGEPSECPVWAELSITPVNEFSLSFPRCQSHIHVPSLAAGANTVTESLLSSRTGLRGNFHILTPAWEAQLRPHCLHHTTGSPRATQLQHWSLGTVQGWS